MLSNKLFQNLKKKSVFFMENKSVSC